LSAVYQRAISLSKWGNFGAERNSARFGNQPKRAESVWHHGEGSSISRVPNVPSDTHVVRASEIKQMRVYLEGGPGAGSMETRVWLFKYNSFLERSLSGVEPAPS